MRHDPMCRFAETHKALLAVGASKDAMFLCSYLAHVGFLQTGEFSSEFNTSRHRLCALMSKLLNAGLVSYNFREQGIFNGWVVTESGLAFLQRLRLFKPDENVYGVPGHIAELVRNSLSAQSRHGEQPPSVDAVISLLGTVPEERQEWLGFAVCYEPIPMGELGGLLHPTEDDGIRLCKRSEAEITRMRLGAESQATTKPEGKFKDVEPQAWEKTLRQ